MSKIVLISCASKKSSKKEKAKDMYISQLFKSNLSYSNSLNPKKTFILSAKYGLLDLEEEIEPYNLTLNTMKDNEIKLWAEKVLEQLKLQGDIEKDEFVFLAGEKYRRHLTPHIKNYQVPLKNLGIGKQLKFLKEANENNSEEKENTSQKEEKMDTCKNCQQLHEIFNSMKKHSFPFNENEIPKNGIYILFEKGEKAHGTERIVRIGTHTGQDNLRNRLNEHFINENKDRSIFRKNIGRCLLKGDSFLKDWELTPLIKQVREDNPNIDFEKQKQIEKQVSDYIQNNFSFVVFPIEDMKKRLELESKIISTISQCKQCKSSSNWLGLNSPKEKIKQSGLWLVNELYKSPLDDKELDELKKSIGINL